MLAAICIGAGAPGVVGVEIFIEVNENTVIKVQVDLVLGDSIDLHPSNLAQEAQGVVVKALPKVVIDAVEKALRSLSGPVVLIAGPWYQ